MLVSPQSVCRRDSVVSAQPREKLSDCGFYAVLGFKYLTEGLGMCLLQLKGLLYIATPCLLKDSLMYSRVASNSLYSWK